MIKKITAVAVFGLLLTSCVQRGKALKPEEMSDGLKSAQGKTIFENNCGRCHDLPSPKDYTDEQWIGIVNAMAPRSKITNAQGEMVYLYLTSQN